MRGAILAAALAALSGAVSAHDHRRAHSLLAERKTQDEALLPATQPIVAPVQVPASAPVLPAADSPKPLAERGFSALTSNNDHLGITYTPYDPQNGNCKSAAQVDQDIARLHSAGFSVVRTYSTDCGTLDSVGAACAKYGMKMIIGVFIGGGGGCTYDSPNIKPQVDAIAAWARWDLVSLFVVGNEAIQNGFCSPAQIRDLIGAVRSKCSYRGPYTTSETINIWQRADMVQAICGSVDMSGANIHGYFNPSVPASSAGDFVAGQLEILGRACPGKPPITLECGWPTAGVCNGAACPGVDQQRQAVQSIRNRVGSKTIFFSPDNDRWKAVGSCGCEQSWGLISTFA